MSPRRLWLQLHRWLALILGVPLAFVALLGALLTIAKPIDQWAHPGLFQANAAASPAPHLLARTQQGIRDEFGVGAGLTFRPPRLPGETLWVMVRGPWQGTVYIDPATGAELGRRGEHDGLYNLLFELHSSLLLEDRGKAMVATLALVYVVLLVSGLVLWWPRRWAGAWRIELRRGLRRALFDLHRVGGAALGLLVAVSVVTGAYMAWRPLSSAITTVTGAAPVRPPEVSAASPVRLTLDEAVNRAAAVFPDGRIGYVQVPAGVTKPVRVRLRLPDDPHPNGLSSVWLHPVDGRVLATHRWNELDPGARGYAVIYPLHTGELGGAWHTLVNGLSGLVLAGFAASGLWLWWKRRS